MYQGLRLERDCRYFVNDIEVAEAEFVAEERRCGFHNTLGHPEKPATGGFVGADGTKGSVSYGL